MASEEKEPQINADERRFIDSVSIEKGCSRLGFVNIELQTWG